MTPPKPRLAVSFSGGETSGRMTKWILENLADTFEIAVTFANTGEEDERTLLFVHQCDQEFGFGTVWVEAVVDPRGRGRGFGTTHRIVTYETASRSGFGSSFEDGVRKYGLPNKNFPWCNRELKLRPMQSYLRSIGWEPGTYHTAIGIRADEAGRFSATAEQDKLIYPLGHPNLHPIGKPDVNDWWEEQPFRLELQGYEGNCKWCWKKTVNKHLLLANERPEIYAFPRTMEQRYPNHGAPHYGAPPEGTPPRKIFRERRSVDDIFALAATVADDVPRLRRLLKLDPDAGGGCGESCEVFGADQDYDGATTLVDESVTID